MHEQVAKAISIELDVFILAILLCMTSQPGSAILFYYNTSSIDFRMTHQ